MNDLKIDVEGIIRAQLKSDDDYRYDNVELVAQEAIRQAVHNTLVLAAEKAKVKRFHRNRSYEPYKDETYGVEKEFTQYHIATDQMVSVDSESILNLESEILKQIL